MPKIIYNPARLIIITGVPGCGKSTLSTGLFNKSGRKLNKGLLDLIQATYIDKDAINDAFSTEIRSGQLYDNLRIGVYKIMDNLAYKNLTVDNTVIIDATYQSEIQNPEWTKRYRNMVKKLETKLKLIRCIAPENIVKQRLIARNLERDKHKLSPTGWKEFLQKEPIKIPWPDDGLVVDTSKDFDKNIEIVLDYLQK